MTKNARIVTANAHIDELVMDVWQRDPDAPMARTAAEIRACVGQGVSGRDIKWSIHRLLQPGRFDDRWRTAHARRASATRICAIAGKSWEGSPMKLRQRQMGTKRFGRAARKAREVRGETMRAVAERIGISYGYLGSIERSAFTPGAEIAFAIGAEYEWTMDALLDACSPDRRDEIIGWFVRNHAPAHLRDAVMLAITNHGCVR